MPRRRGLSHSREPQIGLVCVRRQPPHQQCTMTFEPFLTHLSLAYSLIRGKRQYSVRQPALSLSPQGIGHNRQYSADPAPPYTMQINIQSSMLTTQCAPCIKQLSELPIPRAFRRVPIRTQARVRMHVRFALELVGPALPTSVALFPNPRYSQAFINCVSRATTSVSSQTSCTRAPLPGRRPIPPSLIPHRTRPGSRSQNWSTHRAAHNSSC